MVSFIITFGHGRHSLSCSGTHCQSRHGVVDGSYPSLESDFCLPFTLHSFSMQSALHLIACVCDVFVCSCFYCIPDYTVHIVQYVLFDYLVCRTLSTKYVALSALFLFSVVI